MRFDFLNETWKFVRRKMRHADGLCCAEKRVVTVDSRLEGERELEIILHELAHASDWWKDEKFAEMYAATSACRDQEKSAFTTQGRSIVSHHVILGYR